jgi:hypothetical protein
MIPPSQMLITDEHTPRVVKSTGDGTEIELGEWDG